MVNSNDRPFVRCVRAHDSANALNVPSGILKSFRETLLPVGPENTYRKVWPIGFDDCARLQSTSRANNRKPKITTGFPNGATGIPMRTAARRGYRALTNNGRLADNAISIASTTAPYRPNRPPRSCGTGFGDFDG